MCLIATVSVEEREAELQSKAHEMKYQVAAVEEWRKQLAAEKQREVESARAKLRAEAEAEKRQARESLEEVQREKAKLEAWKARLQSVQTAQLAANDHLAQAEEERQAMLDRVMHLE
ncbi:conserved hypothetical protein [Perkinsus marinus ATCC 50983]|uniref:Uncharacterized protein n=1 Tax=Perkinsus marinus (strain ATCC 50983 / TXsc) TaxID=423536 RepID=C5KIE5_PERM5|nr:conserved hypothetical protein [Perkinsus marinus ATCC 50983]EER15748.1 conserved hypothetical protein [Perkinsus marinus ATCC 50983]|eukprot:XP_002783952.1 conserved hypothetical protein [Perkinsus marinus ATCC 50983]